MNGFSLHSSKAGTDQLIITAAVNDSHTSAKAITEGIYQELDSLMSECNMRILHERIFGSLDFYESFVKVRKENCSFGPGPFTYVEGMPCKGNGLAGVQIHAVRPILDEDYWTIHYDGVPCGHGWKQKNTTYIYLAGITGFNPLRDDRKEQAGLMFDKINRILDSQNVGYRNVVRTWIYLSDILEWYDEFNLIRNDKYRKYDLIPDNIPAAELDRLYLPASTGIRGKSRAGVSVISDVLAIAGDAQISVLQGASQQSSYRYGSAFSRGICIQENDHRHLLVSGTASIDERGNSLHSNNVEAQITRTLECVDSLLGENDAKLSDIQSATVYLKRPEDLTAFYKVAKSVALKNLPAIFAIADICREELLFEMDAWAVIGK